MERRQIPEALVRQVVVAPEQVVSSEKGRTVYQSRVQDAVLEAVVLLRVVVEEQPEELLVITAYKTSKIAKYWQSEAEL